ncbi:MAG: HDIG domain-containing protein [Planctomycetes bacterium]|nr:HDIG domain-containing protein [Planctomycetota bacterium]
MNRPGPALPIETVERSPITFNALVATLFALATVAILNYGAIAANPAQVWLRLGGYAVLTGLSTVVLALYVRILHPEMRFQPRRVFCWGLALVALFALVRIYPRAGWPLELVPVTLVGMVLAIAFGHGLAIANIFVFTLLARLTGLLVGDEYHAVLALFPGSALAVFGMRTLRRRSRILNVGIIAGLVHAATLVGIHLVTRDRFDMHEHLGFLENEAALGFVNGAATAFVVTGLLPFLENVFGITTDLSLLEWSDFNQPLLKKLSLEAPGTHYHSIRVSELAEAAAAGIGANALLTRVGCLYHDIGKTNKPEYFVENDPNAGAKHKSLSPAMSTLIIKAHVKDGVEMGEYYGLPPEVVEFIPQHHGTMLIEYFYREAISQAEEAGAGEQVDPEAFRYGGPRPQTRETAIAMLADGVEAAARSLTDPTPTRLEGLVRDIAQKRLNDGQFSECNLTMQELEKVIDSFVRTLAGIYHSRIRYPGQKPDAELDRAPQVAAGDPRLAEKRP